MNSKLIFLIITIIIVCVLIVFYKNNNYKINEVDIVGSEEKKMENKVRYVSMDEIVDIMNDNENYIILDVRTEEEYKEGHIPNAICIPNETIDEKIVKQLPNKDQLVLIYCRSGNRSKQATKKLENLGYTNLIEFGGIIDWKGEIVKN